MGKLFKKYPSLKVYYCKTNQCHFWVWSVAGNVAAIEEIAKAYSKEHDIDYGLIQYTEIDSENDNPLLDKGYVGFWGMHTEIPHPKAEIVNNFFEDIA